jgi:hypothetical protein
MPTQTILFGLRTEKKLILIFYIFAAIRVAFYSSIFPFFNNVDELMHFDLVIKYRDGYMPRKMDRINQTSANYIAGCSSTEYAKVDTTKMEVPYFLQNLNDSIVKRNYIGTAEFWKGIYNFESGLAPVYYVIVGLWAKLGTLTGLFDQESCMYLYWIRSINILLIVLLAFISYKFSKLIFPADELLRLSVPLFAAFLPQDTFYSIQNDSMSPIAFGIVLINLIPFLKTDTPTYKQAIYLGLSLAFLILVKISNLPVFIIGVAFVFMHLLLNFKKITISGFIKHYAVVFFCSLLPLLLWLIRNLLNFGDFTASAAKIQHLLWVHKPISTWLASSFFTKGHFGQFWTELLCTCWRGEVIWDGKLLPNSSMDVFYWMSSTLFILAAVTLFLVAVYNKKYSFTQTLFVLSFFSMIVFLIVLSIMFDYGNSGYPSVQRPFFSSGRLISAALIPFLILYLQGFLFVFSWIKNKRIQFWLLVLIVVIISVSEYNTNKVSFQSTCNLFSLIN